MILQVFIISFKAIIRDKFNLGLLFIAFLFFVIPSISTLSLRQVTPLAITLSLSLTSFILLISAVFLGGTSLWKDIERKNIFSVLGMPITRPSYILGKYMGVCSFLLLVSLILTTLVMSAIWVTAASYPPTRPILWNNILWAIFFGVLKYCLLISIAFLFSAVSTSFFLPLFGTITVYVTCNATQGVYDYIHTDQGQQLSVFATLLVKIFYYTLPNFSAFDLSTQAIYGLAIDTNALLLTSLYGLTYIGIILGLTCVIFSRRELQ